MSPVNINQHEIQERKRILLRLANGITTLDELKRLVEIFKKMYKASPIINTFIKWQCYNELRRRLKTNVFSEIGKSYPAGYRRFATHAEYHNTKLFIDLIIDFVKISRDHGDITDPVFYGIEKTDYEITLESATHILLRHNSTINEFINEDSKENGYDPSSFSFGMVADSMMTLFMSLHALDETDWVLEGASKNLVCHVSIYGRKLTIVRDGDSMAIKTFYPRNNNANLPFIEIEKHPEKRIFRKVMPNAV